VLQLSKIVITLPSMLLGSRWSKGHYTIMNDSMLNNHFIANNLIDNMHKAVALDTNIDFRMDMEGRINKNIYRLSYIMNTVRE